MLGTNQTGFRIATESDATDIATLVNRAYRPTMDARGWTHESELVSGNRTSAEQVVSLFRPQSVVLICCQSSAIVACIHVQADGFTSHIGMFATDPAVQGKGHGKLLLSYAERYAVDHFNATTLQMFVVSASTALLAFYERRGYVRTGEVRDYPLSEEVGHPIVEGLQLVTLIKRI